MSKNNFGRLPLAAILSASVVVGCGGRDAANLDDFPSEPARDTSEVYLEAESLTLEGGAEVNTITNESGDLVPEEREIIYRGLESNLDRIHLGLNSAEFFEIQTRTSQSVTLDFAGEAIGFVVDNFVSEAIIISYLADLALPSGPRYTTLSVEHFNGSEWEDIGDINIEPTDGVYRHAYINLNEGNGFFFGAAFRIVKSANDVASITIDRIAISQTAQLVEDPQFFDLANIEFVDSDTGNLNEIVISGTLPSGDLAISEDLDSEEPVSVEDLTDLEDQRSVIAERVVASDLVSGGAVLLDEPLESIEIIVPAEARGVAQLEFTYTNATDGRLDLRIVDELYIENDSGEIVRFAVDVDGEFIVNNDGEFVEAPGGMPMLDLDPDGNVQYRFIKSRFGPDFIEIEEGQTRSDIFFSVGAQQDQILQIVNRSGSVELQSVLMVGPQVFERFELEDGEVVSNDIPEFNGANAGVVDGFVANVTGNGDGVMLVAPYPASRLAFGYASQFDSEHDLYVLSPEEAATFNPQAPRSENEAFRTAVISAPANSPNFVDISPGALPEVSITLEEEVNVGDVIYILFGTAAANYDYLNFFE